MPFGRMDRGALGKAFFLFTFGGALARPSCPLPSGGHLARPSFPHEVDVEEVLTTTLPNEPVSSDEELDALSNPLLPLPQVRT